MVEVAATIFVVVFVVWLIVSLIVVAVEMFSGQP